MRKKLLLRIIEQKVVTMSFNLNADRNTVGPRASH
jgi:hypothetical protein